MVRGFRYSMTMVMIFVIFSSQVTADEEYLDATDIYDLGDQLTFQWDYFILNADFEKVPDPEERTYVVEEIYGDYIHFGLTSNSLSFEQVGTNKYSEYYTLNKHNGFFLDLTGLTIGDEIMEYHEDLTDAYTLDPAFDTVEQVYIVDETEYYFANQNQPAWIAQLDFLGYSSWLNFTLTTNINFTLSKTTGMWFEVHSQYSHVFDNGTLREGGGLDHQLLRATGVNFSPPLHTSEDQAQGPSYLLTTSTLFLIGLLGSIKRRSNRQAL